ncbi:uncharacterized protein LOC106804155 [Setaria italica]|uniref:uncharacterized protein LOC106804155 n=1 Tax=Setaria italica TaxID=4555 RepID=UPI000350A114|nr:uncharacterized protein LOC106804155 [Setaria italica]
MIGPFKKASGGYDHILVAIDKFTKWIEVKPIKMLTDANTVEFIAKITHRFGVPNRIITNLGTNFTSWGFQDICDKQNIKVYHTSVTYPRPNGQVERPSRATGQTPFFLMYESKVVLPTDLMFSAARVEMFKEDEAKKECIEDIDSIKEERVAACIQDARCTQGLHRYHDKNIQARGFCVGELVLRRIQSKKDMHKLAAPWEGSFIVKEVTRSSSCQLMRKDGIDVPNSWNIEHLRCFFP